MDPVRLGYAMPLVARRWAASMALLCLISNQIQASLLDNIHSLAAGERFTCALDGDGTVWCWGRNSRGQLGNGNNQDSSRLVRVLGLTSPAVMVTAGSEHACVLTADDAVQCWGYNGLGQLGDGSTDDSNLPITVAGLGSGMAGVSAGYWHTCAVSQTGAASCWGSNAFGQLGDASNQQRLTPAAVFALSSGVNQILATGEHSCAVLDSTGLMCWGYNIFGQLGLNYTANRNIPFAVVGLSSDTRRVAGGHFHTCVLLDSTGNLQCFGNGLQGQLGDGQNINHWTATDVLAMGSNVNDVDGGFSHTCALDSDRSVYCWGENNNGQLGTGNQVASNLPVAVSGLASGLNTLSLGFAHSCVVTGDGEVFCWGKNLFGQLGDGTEIQSLLPVGVVGWQVFGDGFEDSLK